MSITLDLDAEHYKKNSKSQYVQAKNLLQDIAISPKAWILDIGCGHGHIIGELSKAAPLGKSIGIDPSQNMISLASENFAEHEYNNLEFHQLKAEDMSFSHESFDLVLCTNVFMWVREPRKVLNLISKFLKPNGQLILFSYSKETPYVQLFENALEATFPELKKHSAVNTMLPTELHSTILAENHMTLDLFKVEDVIFEYENVLAFKNYVLGWLSCYVPLNPLQQEIFLEKVIEGVGKFRKNQNTSVIAIPHKTIAIKASKMNQNS